MRHDRPGLRGFSNRPSRRRLRRLPSACAGMALALAAGVGVVAGVSEAADSPLSGPAPGSPVFDSFSSRFDGQGTTVFLMSAHTATNAGLAYIWSLENAGCGHLTVAGQTSAPTNGYYHGALADPPNGCPTPPGIEINAVVQVVVARAADVDASGHVRGGAPYLVYSQLARAHDSPQTVGYSTNVKLTYFVAAATSVIPTPTAGPTAGTPTPVTVATAVNPDESTIASALVTPSSAFSSLTNTLTNALLTLLVILFITFPSQLFNHTLEENYEEIRDIASRRFGWLRRLRVRRRTGAHSKAREAIVFCAVLLVGAALGGLNDPEFGVNVRSAATYTAVVLAILIGVAVSFGTNRVYRHLRSHEESARFHALPAGLVIAAGCVLVSRLTDFQPGYLYGLIVGVVFGGSLTAREEGHSVAIGVVATMVVAVVAWILWVPVHAAASHPAAGFRVVLASDLLASLVIGGLIGSVIGLIPLRFLPGARLAGWSRTAWAITFGVAVFGLVEVMLRPESASAHSGSASIATAIVLFVVFGGSSLAFRGYFSLRKRGAREHD